MHLAIQWAAVASIALVGTYLVKLCLDWHAARANIQARLNEIRNRRYDWRIIERNWHVSGQALPGLARGAGEYPGSIAGNSRYADL